MMNMRRSPVPPPACLPGLLCLVLACSGCATQTRVQPAATLPDGYTTPGPSGGVSVSQAWWQGFASAELNDLVEQAARGNWDLAAAAARVKQADARARQAGAAILPSIDAAGNANFFAGHSSQGGGHELDWSAMLSASYELDFWGKNRAVARSAQLLSSAARAERDTVVLTALAGVATGYFQVQALRERLAIARSNSDAARQLLEVVQARFDAGAASPVELAAQKTAYAVASIAILDLQQAEAEARASLAILLGRAPENFSVQDTPLAKFTEPSIDAGLPATLLTRRPDIALAETTLEAAHADLKAARAAMLPSISLTAGAGLQNPALPAAVLTIPGVGPSFALGAGLMQPIFDHGRLRAQRDEVQAKEEELLASYRGSIIAALGDVENALAAIHHLDLARDLQQETVTESERAFEGARLRYQAGSGDFLTLLEAQRTLYVSRDQYTIYRVARLNAVVGLFKALGGGWGQTDRAQARVTRNFK
jgi:outer membrane protein, multidrug efflux system